MVELSLSEISKMIPFMCSIRCKIVFDHLRLSLNAVNVVLIGKFGIKYQYSSRAVCAYEHVFWKQPGCALIGACALIGTNTVLVHAPL